MLTLRATLELFYHSVSVVSVRFPQERPGDSPPTLAISSRRSLSADRITSIFGEFPGELSYLPVMPYAASLSLGVAYRKMRHGRVPLFRDRGRRAFTANAAVLHKLAGHFWAARTMATLAEQVLNEMDRAAVSLAQDGDSADRWRSTPADSHPNDAGSVGPPAPGLDQSIFGVMPELDVFGHFDPSFNLDAVDAALQGSLDFGISSNWFDSQHF